MNGVENNGLGSLFRAANSIASRGIQASAPSVKERVLRGENRTLSSENERLESTNRDLRARNRELKSENQELNREVQQASAPRAEPNKAPEAPEAPRRAEPISGEVIRPREAPRAPEPPPRSPVAGYAAAANNSDFAAKGSVVNVFA